MAATATVRKLTWTRSFIIGEHVIVDVSAKWVWDDYGVVQLMHM